MYQKKHSFCVRDQQKHFFMSEPDGGDDQKQLQDLDTLASFCSELDFLFPISTEVNIQPNEWEPQLEPLPRLHENNADFFNLSASLELPIRPIQSQIPLIRQQPVDEQLEQKQDSLVAGFRISNRWTSNERAILVGVLFRVFLASGKFSFSNQEDDEDGFSWNFIYNLFEKASAKYKVSFDPSIEVPARSKNSIRRQFKTLKVKAGKGRYSFKDAFSIWQQLNENDQLLQSHEFDAIREPTTESRLDAPRSNSWTHSEEVILVGSIMEVVFDVGTLHSLSRWETVQSKFLAYQKHFLTGERKTKRRSPTALQRHLKTMRQAGTDIYAHFRYFTQTFL